jgi:uncharacterized membrane protein
MDVHEEHREHEVKDLYDIGLILKAMESALEIAAGVAVFFVSRTFVLRIVEFATAGELAHDPTDFVANTLRHAAHAFSIYPHYLLAGYLIVRGAVKLLLIVLILRGVRTAYPLFIIALGLFGSYEAYRAVLTVNYILGAVALFDAALIFLTAYEYKRRYVA